ncbi:Putative ribonuclease H protein At1g65750, partial [Linum perenne]
LNSDGSLLSQNNRAAAGGLVRDFEGNLITSYVINLGPCSIMRAELRGIIEGMKIVWDRGVRRLCIQTDSQAAISLLSSKEGRMHRHASLVEQFIDLKIVIGRSRSSTFTVKRIALRIIWLIWAILLILGLMFVSSQIPLFCTGYVMI